MYLESRSARIWAILISALCGLVFLIRLTGPTDLESYAQVLNVGYILDLMNRGHWLVQYDLENVIMSKPPIHTWLMAPFTMLLGLNRLALTLPSFLAVLALALILFEVGRRRFGELAGGLAALAIVLAPTMAKQVALVRTDPVFTLTVAIAAIAAFSAWERGGEKGRKAWFLFWLMSAITTLIKGPLGFALAAGGLLSFFWEKRSNPQQRPPSGPHLRGLTIFLVLSLGWFGAALISEGRALIDKMLYAELIYHAVGEHKGGWHYTDLLKPTFFLAVRYLPFSIPFFFALWRVVRHPAANPEERRFERFLTCWVLFGLLLFSLAKHQRADHLLPLWPACALLAGREMARFAERIGKTRFAGISVVVSIILIGSTYAAVNSTNGNREGSSDYSREMQLASDAENAAKAFLARKLDARQLNHLDTPITLQLYLGTYHPFISRAQLDELLANADHPVDVAFGKTTIEELGVAQRYPDTTRVFRWPENESEKPVFQVYRVNPNPPRANSAEQPQAPRVP